MCSQMFHVARLCINYARCPGLVACPLKLRKIAIPYLNYFRLKSPGHRHKLMHGAHNQFLLCNTTP